MTGLEPVVAGYLMAWVTQKLRRVGARVDGKVDGALDAGVDRLGELVSGKLGNDSALVRLAEDAARGVDDERTRQRVQLAVEDAAERDPVFADQLRALVAQLQPAAATGQVVINAKAEGHAQMPVLGSGRMDITFGSPGAP